MKVVQEERPQTGGDGGGFTGEGCHEGGVVPPDGSGTCVPRGGSLGPSFKGLPFLTHPTKVLGE